MSELKRIRVFRYEELEDAAKNRARDWLLEGFSSITVEHLADEAEYLLSEAGLEMADRNKFYWDLERRAIGGKLLWKDNYTQRCLIAEAIIRTCPDNVARYALAWLEHNLMDITIRIDHGGVREPSFQTDVELDYSNPFSARYDPIQEKTVAFDPRDLEMYEDNIESYIEQWVYDLGQNIISSMKSSCEDMESDEYLQELCEINDYMFDMNGKPVHHLIEKEANDG